MSRIFDSSHLTARKQERAIAGSFLTQVDTAPGSATTYMRGSQPMLGIKDNSIMAYVKTGGMTQYTRFPTCIGVSAGCPCPVLEQSLSTPPYVPAIPGQVSGIVFTVGSIIVSWNAPSTGVGPFTYRVTPYLNGVALAPVRTSETTHRFNNLEDWKPYTFTVCAINAVGDGPDFISPYFLAPPENLSRIMAGTDEQLDPVSSLQYVLNSGLDVEILSSAGWGPTRDEACRQKMTWLENHDLGYLPVTFTTNKIEKSNHALASSILIDDHLECINPFIDKGGCGILHKDADTTINTLNSILFATRRYA